MDLIGTLAAHRNHLLSSYQGAGWDEVATAYGATGNTRQEQLDSALRAVVDWARQLPEADAVRGHLDTFVQDTLDEVAPKTGATAGLAMIFANAGAHASWWADKYSSETTYIADCNGCGAPQLRVLHFQCEYCGEPLYPKT